MTLSISQTRWQPEQVGPGPGSASSTSHPVSMPPLCLQNLGLASCTSDIQHQGQQKCWVWGRCCVAKSCTGGCRVSTKGRWTWRTAAVCGSVPRTVGSWLQGSPEVPRLDLGSGVDWEGDPCPGGIQGAAQEAVAVPTSAGGKLKWKHRPGALRKRPPKPQQKMRLSGKAHSTGRGQAVQ